MRDGALAPTGGLGGIVEIDETKLGFQAGANPKTQRHAGDCGKAIGYDEAKASSVGHA